MNKLIIKKKRNTYNDKIEMISFWYWQIFEFWEFFFSFKCLNIFFFWIIFAFFELLLPFDFDKFSSLNKESSSSQLFNSCIFIFGIEIFSLGLL